MRKRNNRKGFTIVELVIVIAVIAILATIMVPTFGDVIANANKSALVQKIKNAHTNYTVKHAADASFMENVTILLEEKYYQFENGTIKMENDGKTPYVKDEKPTTGYYWDADNDKLMHFYEDAQGNDANADGYGKCDLCGKAKGDNELHVPEQNNNVQGGGN